MSPPGGALKGGARKKTIVGQFAWRLVEMLESPAYRTLSLSGHRVLARLELELGAHGGNENGKLPTTFDQFEEYGIHRQAIAPAIREVVALGFIEVTQVGRAGNAEWRRPSLYRLTYRHTELTMPTDDWRRTQTIDEAETIATAARKAGEKRKSSGGNRTKVQCGNRTSNGHFHSTETTTTSHSTETTITSISREDSANGRSPPSAQPANEQARKGGLAQMSDAANVILLAAKDNRLAKKSGAS